MPLPNKLYKVNSSFEKFADGLIQVCSVIESLKPFFNPGTEMYEFAGTFKELPKRKVLPVGLATITTSLTGFPPV